MTLAALGLCFAAGACRPGHEAVDAPPCVPGPEVSRSQASATLRDPRQAAFDKAGALGRGINLGNALEAPVEGNWGVELTVQDFVDVAQAGFQHVRLPVRWSAHALNEEPYTIEPAFLARVDWAIDTALSLGLRVVVNLHHYDELMQAPEAHRARFLGIWKELAEHYQSYPDRLYFELLNEPHGALGDEQNNRLLAEAIATVRPKNPDRMLIVGPTQWSQIPKLSGLQLPEADPGLIVTFHYYEPYPFTHQGAPWAPELRSQTGVDWSATTEETQRLQTDFEQALRFSRERRRPLYLGEFGVYRAAPLAARQRWIAAVASLASQFGIACAYWELRAGFGAFDPARQVWRRELLDAILPSHRVPAGRIAGEQERRDCAFQAMAKSPRIRILSIAWASDDHARDDIGPPGPDGKNDVVLQLKVEGPVQDLYVLSVDAKGRAMALAGQVYQFDTVLSRMNNPLAALCSPYAACETPTLALLEKGQLLNAEGNRLNGLDAGVHQLQARLSIPERLKGTRITLQAYAETAEGVLLASQPFSGRL